MVIKRIISLLLALMPILLYATNWYVACPDSSYVGMNTGDDDAIGNFANPWESWARAFNAEEVQPGDTVFIRGGVYWKDDHAHTSSWYYPYYYAGAGYKVSAQGTSGARVVFAAYEDETPILDCDNVTPTTCSNRGVRYNSVSYVDFVGLTIRNVHQTPDGVASCGINAQQCYGWEVSSNVKFINCKAYNIHGIGFETYGGTMYYENCDAWNCADSLSAVGHKGERGTGFASIVTSNVNSSVIYKNCRAWNCSDQGISMFNVGYIEVDGGWFWSHGYLDADGSGLKIGFVYVSSTNLRRKINNVITAYNKGAGINFNDNVSEVFKTEIYNNTSYRNGFKGGALPGYGFLLFDTDDNATAELMRALKNNIGYDNQTADFYLQSGGACTQEYNSWNTPPGKTITDNTFLSLPDDENQGDSLLSQSRNADGSLPDIGNYFKLNPDAPTANNLVDAGTDVGLQYIEDAPDLGAFEYEPTSDTATDILTFSTTEQYEIPEINTTNHTVTGKYNNNEGSTQTITYTLSSGATGIPLSGTSQDISNLDITVTAADEVTQQVWNIAFTEQTPPDTANTTDFLTFTFDSIVGSANINMINHTITALATENTNLSAITATWTLSDTATSAPTSGTSQDYSSPLSVTVTAADGYTEQEWTITITLQSGNQSPTCTILTPQNGATYVNGDNIYLSAEANDLDGSISALGYYVNDELYGLVGDGDWGWTWNGIPTGDYTMTSFAVDNEADTTWATPVSITVIDLSASKFGVDKNGQWVINKNGTILRSKQ